MLYATMLPQLRWYCDTNVIGKTVEDLVGSGGDCYKWIRTFLLSGNYSIKI
jgi:hypothetical protein